MPRNPNVIELTDLKTYDKERVSETELGQWLWDCRMETPSEESGREDCWMSRRELAAIINDNLAEHEYPISESTIAAIERGTNMHQGYWDRIMQICWALDIGITLTANRHPRMRDFSF